MRGRKAAAMACDGLHMKFASLLAESEGEIQEACLGLPADAHNRIMGDRHNAHSLLEDIFERTSVD